MTSFDLVDTEIRFWGGTMIHYYITLSSHVEFNLFFMPIHLRRINPLFDEHDNIKFQVRAIFFSQK